MLFQEKLYVRSAITLSAYPRDYLTSNTRSQGKQEILTKIYKDLKRNPNFQQITANFRFSQLGVKTP